jgi:hypothetical protein|tara:strand:+ start:152 stop:325 length:174 start_codon:yes stop_codon:yes gene_type:complete
MRNKELVQKKIERIELLLKSLNFHIGRLERKEAYQVLDEVTAILPDIQTLLNTETQD